MASSGRATRSAPPSTALCKAPAAFSTLPHTSPTTVLIWASATFISPPLPFRHHSRRYAYDNLRSCLASHHNSPRVSTQLDLDRRLANHGHAAEMRPIADRQRATSKERAGTSATQIRAGGAGHPREVFVLAGDEVREAHRNDGYLPSRPLLREHFASPVQRLEVVEPEARDGGDLFLL